MNIHHDTAAEHRRLLVAGVAYSVAVLLLIWLSVAIYNKAFTPVTMVTIKAERAGLQLPRFGDVRVHGVIVGQVREIAQDGSEAEIKVALQPDAAKRIPENVSVEIRPTTLFGQKYVALVDPAQASAKPLRDGSVIPSSRVVTNVELQQVLATLFPLLRSIRPADLNTTLYALSTALSGRGEKLGATITDLDAYLRTMNVHLPTLKADLEGLAGVSKAYALAAPDMVRLLRNATTTADTIATQRGNLAGFIAATTQLAITGNKVLASSGDLMVREARLASPLTRLLDSYSPEYTCLLQGLDRFTARLAEVFKNNRVWQVMSLDARQRPGYKVADRPEYAAIGYGPQCRGLPDPPRADHQIDLPNGTDSDKIGAR